MQKPEDSTPTSFIVTRGPTGRLTKKLMHELRSVLAPNTATRLRTMKRDRLRDLLTAGQSMGVSHMVIFSLGKNPQMRMFRTIRGPTLDFEVSRFTLATDVAPKRKISTDFYQTAPALLMNNFDTSKSHEKHIVEMFTSLFPSLNVSKAKISRIRRVVLINKLSDSEEIEFRHYGILIYPGKVSMGLRDLFKYNVPDMRSLNDISDYIFADSRRNTDSANINSNSIEEQSSTASVRLFEIGPRFTMKLTKIYEGIAEKEILYHSRIQKTESEKKELRKRHSDKAKLKQERIAQQEANVAAKKEKLTQKIIKNKMRLQKYQEKIKQKFPEKST